MYFCVCLLLLNIMFVRCIHVFPVPVVHCHYCIQFHYMNMPQLIYPFFCQWSFGLIPIFGYVEFSCCEYSSAFLFAAHISLKYIPIIRMLSYRVCICSILDNSLALSTKVDVPIYTSVYEHSCCYTFWPTLDVIYFQPIWQVCRIIHCGFNLHFHDD